MVYDTLYDKRNHKTFVVQGINNFQTSIGGKDYTDQFLLGHLLLFPAISFHFPPIATEIEDK